MKRSLVSDDIDPDIEYEEQIKYTKRWKKRIWRKKPVEENDIHKYAPLNGIELPETPGSPVPIMELLPKASRKKLSIDKEDSIQISDLSPWE